MKKRLIAIGCVCVGVAGIIGFAILRFVPIGVMCIPYFIASIDEGHHVPGMPWRIVYNDAGAAHSGNFWTWVIEDRCIYRIVVAQGYSTADVRYGHMPLPAKKESGSIYLGFTTNRYGDEIQWQKVNAHASPNDFLLRKEAGPTGIPQSSDPPLNWFEEISKENPKGVQ